MQRSFNKAVKKNNVLSKVNSISSKHSNENTTSVAILMSVHNGARFIAEQINSIVAQSHSNIRLYISDDNSSDGSNAIVKDFIKQSAKKISINNVQNNNFCKSFLQLACDKKIKPSHRSELEITELNKAISKKQQLSAERISLGYT